MTLQPSWVESRLARMDRLRSEMQRREVDAVLCSLGADLPWLTGYEAMPLERLTMLVFPAEAHPTLVVPALEAARVPHEEVLFSLRPWGETEDPVAIVAELLGSTSGTLALSDRTWSTFLLALQDQIRGARFMNASEITAELRSVKDESEVAALQAAATAADRVADALLAGEIPLIGRTEAQVSADIGRRLIELGHSRVNFAIVGSAENSASPHHEPGLRRIEGGDVVVCDFGGSYSLDGGPGYCSDITRTIVTGDPPARFIELYEVLQAAQEAGVGAAAVGTSCSSVDAVPRSIIEEAGYGEFFVHRTGHGIGIEEHEDPYIVAGNDKCLVPSNAFSIEPGIYLPGSFGARIEDIVIATTEGPRVLNNADRSLTVVQA